MTSGISGLHKPSNKDGDNSGSQKPKSGDDKGISSISTIDPTPTMAEDPDISDIKPTIGGIDSHQYVFVDPINAGFTMSVAEDKIYRLARQVEYNFVRDLRTLKREQPSKKQWLDQSAKLKELERSLSVLPDQRVDDRTHGFLADISKQLGELTQTVNAQGMILQGFNDRLERVENDVRQIGAGASYQSQYFMGKIQDVYLKSGWLCPTGNTPPPSWQDNRSQGSVASNHPSQNAAPPPTGDGDLCGSITVSNWKESFDGKPDEDIELFLDKFELHCTANSTERGKWAILLRLRLNGLAESIVNTLSDEDKSEYSKIKAVLIKTFGREDQYLVARDKIRDERYGTSFNELLASLSSLMPKAYPMENLDFRNGTLYTVLMEKLPPDLIIELKRQGCQTLTDLIKMAPKTEALIKDIRGLSQPRHVAQRVNVAHEPFVDFTNVGIVGTDLSVHTAPRPSPHDLVPPARYKANRKSISPSQQQQLPPICGFCNRSGHPMALCQDFLRVIGQGNSQGGPQQSNYPQRSQSFQQRSGYFNRNTPRYCYLCNRPGHMARDCYSQNPYGTPMAPRHNDMNYLSNQFQQMQLQQPRMQPPYAQPGYSYAQPHHTAVAMAQHSLEPPRQSTSLPVVCQPLSQHQVPAQQQTPGTFLAMPQQPSVQFASPGQNFTSAIQQATGTQQEPVSVDAPMRVYTHEDFRRMEDQLAFLASKVYQKADQENPSSDILATLTRHENGLEPEFVPVDQRLVIIPVTVQGYGCNALFDSGSSITVAPIALADILKIDLQDSNRNITAVTGHSAAVTKSGFVRLSIAGHKREVEIFFTGNFWATRTPMTSS